MSTTPVACETPYNRPGTTLGRYAWRGKLCETIKRDRLAQCERGGIGRRTRLRIWLPKGNGSSTLPVRTNNSQRIQYYTCSMYDSGTSSWNRSFMELTKILLGDFQRRGRSSGGWPPLLRFLN